MNNGIKGLSNAGRVTAYAAFLTVSSLWVIVQGATDEPYVRFRADDALVQVGLGTTLLILWIQFSAFIGIKVLSKQVKPWCSLLLVWALLVCAYLILCPIGYVQDIEYSLGPCQPRIYMGR